MYDSKKTIKKSLNLQVEFEYIKKKNSKTITITENIII